MISSLPPNYLSLHGGVGKVNKKAKLSVRTLHGAARYGWLATFVQGVKAIDSLEENERSATKNTIRLVCLCLCLCLKKTANNNNNNNYAGKREERKKERKHSPNRRLHAALQVLESYLEGQQTNKCVRSAQRGASRTFFVPGVSDRCAILTWLHILLAGICVRACVCLCANES